MTCIVAGLVLLLAIAALRAFECWYQAKAWHDADHEARRYMRRHYW